MPRFDAVSREVCWQSTRVYEERWRVNKRSNSQLSIARTGEYRSYPRLRGCAVRCRQPAIAASATIECEHGEHPGGPIVLSICQAGFTCPISIQLAPSEPEVAAGRMP